MQKAQMDSLLYDFDSSLFYVEEEKGLFFFFYWKEVEISDFNASTIFILFNSILED